MSFTVEDYSNIQACVGYASCTLDAESLPTVGNLVTTLGKASRGEVELSAADKQLSKTMITKALQSQKLIPTRTFDAAIIATLGILVSKLDQTPESSGE